MSWWPTHVHTHGSPSRSDVLQYCRDAEDGSREQKLQAHLSSSGMPSLARATIPSFVSSQADHEVAMPAEDNILRFLIENSALLQVRLASDYGRRPHAARAARTLANIGMSGDRRARAMASGIIRHTTDRETQLVPRSNIDCRPGGRFEWRRFARRVARSRPHRAPQTESIAIVRQRDRHMDKQVDSLRQLYIMLKARSTYGQTSRQPAAVVHHAQG